jgi:hypothetical protein
MLDDQPSVATYCEQPFWIPYRDKGHFPKYFPDVVVALNDGRRVLAELKCAPDLGDFSGFKKWRALLRFAHPPGFGVFIGNCETTLAELFRRDLDQGLVHALTIFAGARTGVTHRHMQILRSRFDFDDAVLSAAVLQAGLYMTRKPFVIRTATSSEASLIKELRKAFLGYSSNAADTMPVISTVSDLSDAALGAPASGGPPWFDMEGWVYEALAPSACPRCRNDLHALRRPWVTPDRRSIRAWAIVCAGCRVARTIGSFEPAVQRTIRAA